MEWLRLGHFTNSEKGTGVSVFLFDEPTVGAYHLCGSSPASLELAVLDLEARVTHVNGLMLTGGSAFGLSASAGVMQWFRENQIGWDTPYGPVPILPVSAIYDLGVVSNLPPSPEEAYQACLQAKKNQFQSGRIGAGTGASIGKIHPSAHRMSAGFGTAKLAQDNGLVVEAYAVVNAVGDVRDAQFNIIAGARLDSGEFVDIEKYLLSGKEVGLRTAQNTTLVAVMIQAKFSKAELKRIAKMASAGLARSISPVFSRYDGDIVYCFASGNNEASEMTAAAMAVHCVETAIRNAVKDSQVI